MKIGIKNKPTMNIKTIPSTFIPEPTPINGRIKIINKNTK